MRLFHPPTQTFRHITVSDSRQYDTLPADAALAEAPLTMTNAATLARRGVEGHDALGVGVQEAGVWSVEAAESLYFLQRDEMGARRHVLLHLDWHWKIAISPLLLGSHGLVAIGGHARPRAV